MHVQVCNINTVTPNEKNDSTAERLYSSLQCRSHKCEIEGPPLPSPFSFLPIPFLRLPFLFPLPSLSLTSLPLPAVPSRHLPSIPPLPHLTGSGGITPGVIFGNKGAREF